MTGKHKGQSIVELALILPVFILIVFGMLDMGRAFYFQEAIANMAREGARYGAVNNTTSVSSEALAEAGALVSGATISSVVKACDSKSEQYVSVTVNYAFSLVTPVMQAFGKPITMTATSRMPVRNDGTQSCP